MPGGTFARRSSSILIVPVSRYSTIFFAVDAPTPLIAARSSRGSVAMSSGAARIASADRS
jgi:hypothetical protein